MDITINEIVAWLIVGALAGSVAGMLVKRKKEGFGRYTNFGIGFVGAVIGGLIFKLFKLGESLSEFKITLRDLVAALVGSLLFLLLVWMAKKFLKKGSSEEAS